MSVIPCSNNNLWLHIVFIGSVYLWLASTSLSFGDIHVPWIHGMRLHMDGRTGRRMEVATMNGWREWMDEVDGWVDGVGGCVDEWIGG